MAVFLLAPSVPTSPLSLPVASPALPPCALVAAAPVLTLSSPLEGRRRQLRQLGVGGSASGRWRMRISFFPSFLTSKDKAKNREALKAELLDVVAPLARGASASPADQERVDQIARELEAVNPVKEPLKSESLNGKWELLYTTSVSLLGTKRPKLLRPNGLIYQAINTGTMRAQNMETWPFFNQVTANLVPLNSKRVAVRFDTFKILGFIPIKAPGRGRGELEITYLDDEIRISRGDKGNLFILRMVDPLYEVPLASS